MNEKEIPAYYSIIPASVRYSDITPNAKLLYGEITALCNKEGYCWANNSYFANLYKVSKVSISKWISQLQEKGFIEVVDPIKKRRIYLKENFMGGIKKSLTPHKEMFIHNNTSNITDNIKYNNIYSEQSSQEEILSLKDIENYLDSMKGKEEKLILIANFIEAKGFNPESPNSKFSFKSKKDIQAVIRRCLRPAQRLLNNYSFINILNVQSLLAKYAKFKWELETIEKYICYSDAEIKRSLIGEGGEVLVLNYN